MANSSNSWLDGIFGDDTFLGDGWDKLSSFGERIYALTLSDKEKDIPAVQAPTPIQSLFGESAPSTQQIVLYAGSAVLLGVAVFYIFKK